MNNVGVQSDSASKCVVFVPVATHIEPACEAALLELAQRGYTVRRVYGYAAIDQARNDMATAALADGFEETLWVDSDISFDPAAVYRLRSHGLPIVCGIYARKGMRALACHALPGTRQLVFGAEGGLTELLYAAAGFLLVRRQVYTDMQERLALPTCNQRFGRPTIPFFQPMVVDDPLCAGLPTPHTFSTEGLGGNVGTSKRDLGCERCGQETAPQPPADATAHWYLPEDYAFCERARRCGYKIMADTTIRLWHHGGYAYSWEDAGKDKERYETFNFNVE